MRIYAYCRVSSLDQDETVQVKAIQQRYPDARVVREKASAVSRDGRPELEQVLFHIREGDKLVVWKLDRLARNMKDLTDIVAELQSRGAALEIFDQCIDTSTAAGNAFLQMLGVFAEFETNLRKERQLAGIQQAREAGKYKGRKQAASGDDVQGLMNQGMSKAEIARKLGVSYRTVLRRAQEAA